MTAFLDKVPSLDPVLDLVFSSQMRSGCDF